MDIDRFLTIAELREQRQRIVADVRERSSSGDVETTYLEQAEKDADALTARIKELEQRDERLGRMLNNPGNIESTTDDRKQVSTESPTQHRGGHWLASAPAVVEARDKLRQRWGLSSRALVGSGVTGGGALTPSDQKTFVFDFLAAQSVFLKSGVVQMQTDRDTVILPHALTDAASAWVSEGATITPADPTADQITATPRKLAGLTVLSNEVIADSNPSVMDWVSNGLLRSLALKFDLGAFEGSGTPPEIRGLKNVSGISTVSMGTNGAIPTNLDPIADAIAALEADNASAGAIVMHPRTWKTFLKLKEVAGSTKALLQIEQGGASIYPARTIYGVPVFLSSQISITETQGTSGAVASSAYVYDVKQAVAVMRQDPRVELDSSRLFNADQSELRCTLRADVQVPNPKGVARILGILA